MIEECTDCGSTKIENKELMLCASCSAARRKAERQSSRVKVSVPIVKVSPKRAQQKAEYAKLKREYIALYPMCEVEDCDQKSIDIHHQRGCEGGRLLDTNYFMAVCRTHHTYYTEHSKEAKEKGVSHSRSATI